MALQRAKYPMNDNTKYLFKYIEENSDESFEKIKVLWQISEQAAKAGIHDIVIDQQATISKEKRSFTLLAYAISCKNIKAFHFLVENGIDVNQGDPSPLLCAIENKLDDVILTLLEQKADVNAGTPSPLSCATKWNDENLIITLIQYGANVKKGDPSPLWYAVKAGNKAIAQLLIDEGADINQQSTRETKDTIDVVISPARKSHKHYYEAQRENKQVTIISHVTPIYQAIEQKNIDITRLLLLNDAKTSTKLTYAEHNFTLPYHYREQEPKEIASQETQVLMDCLEKIHAAKIAFGFEKATNTIRYLSDAYDVNVFFLLDYLANKIRNINLNAFQEELRPDYILEFIDIFSFIAKKDSKKGQEAYSYLQEHVFSELLGHEPENSEQEINPKIKLFTNRQEKIKYLQKFSSGASWENTFNQLAGSGSNLISSSSIQTEQTDNLANLTQNVSLNNFGVVSCFATPHSEPETNQLQPS